MAITASMVKELRELTGAGMMDCKKALEEAGGDLQAAVDILRTKGLADLAKRAGRATNEGVIAASKKLVELAPDGELVIVPGANHLVSVQRPDVVNPVLLGFLQRCVA